MIEIAKRLFVVIFILLSSCNIQKEEYKILVFSKTTGYRHNSIEAGHAAFKKLSEQHGFDLVISEDEKLFRDEQLKEFSAIVFLNTTGDLFNRAQQIALKRYLQAGGSILGIHAATDTEKSWPWFGEMMGARFKDHPNDPNIHPALIKVLDTEHPSTKHFPREFEKVDEYYNFSGLRLDQIQVLLEVDESSYTGGSHGSNHPIAWHHAFENGQVFYTALGHTEASYEDEDFLAHLWGGLQSIWLSNPGKKLQYDQSTLASMPEPDRFVIRQLDSHLDEPTELAVLPDDRVLFIERKGNIKLYLPKEDSTHLIGQLAVYTEQEDGMMGLAIDPSFSANGFIYLYYSPAGSPEKPISVQRLSRFQLVGNSFLPESEKIILEVPVQRDECCHTGGSIAFDSEGLLYLSTGDDTNPFVQDGFSPMDSRQDRAYFDARRSAANTNDLRGKILRIKVQDDGSYSIPEGNLFPEGTKKTLPEIYVMGNRNPYRISIDPKTQTLYWGDVGPDAGKDDPKRGPKGYDEINRADDAGFFGWPLFIADNQSYVMPDQEESSLLRFDPKKPLNLSPHNTGLKELPPAQKALIWYPYGQSPEFPMTGTGGRNAMAGPVYYHDLYEASEGRFPAYYDGKFFIYEWMRKWIKVVSFDEGGNIKSIEPFMEGTLFDNPIDMEFGPKGNLYVLTYGTKWFSQNPNATLIKIDYISGNRPPVAKAKASVLQGASPLEVHFSAEDSYDPEGGELEYRWTFTKKGGKAVKERDPSFAFPQPGIYQVSLEVTDQEGEKAMDYIWIEVGNEAPELAIKLSGHPSYWWPGRTIGYKALVRDAEDGSLEDGGIKPEDVRFNLDFLAQGYDMTGIVQGHQSSGPGSELLKGKKLLNEQGCHACHQLKESSVGPSYLAVAERYGKEKNTETIVKKLSQKVIQGGGGVWGEQVMSAHPHISEQEAEQMIRYVLSLKDKSSKKSTIPLEGSFTPQGHENATEGAYIFQLSYQDRGSQKARPIQAQEHHVLKAPYLLPEKASITQGTFLHKPPGIKEEVLFLNDQGFIAFEQVDLCSIPGIELALLTFGQKGMVEVRLNGVDGELCGTFTLPQSEGLHKKHVFFKEALGKNNDLYFVAKNELENFEAMVGIMSIHLLEPKK